MPPGSPDLTMTHPVEFSDDDLFKECDIRFLRRSGPGGQHRNKVETAVRLTHTPTGIVAEANERRSQAANRVVALKRLRIKLAVEVRGESREAPSELWQSRCRNRKIAINADQADFPVLLAEVLDVLAAHSFDHRPTAEQLGVSNSQLVKFMKKEPSAFQYVNESRKAADLPVLR